MSSHWNTPLSTGMARDSALPVEPLERTLEALRRLDLEQFRNRLDYLVETLTSDSTRPRSRSEVAIRLYDLLRTTADEFSPRNQGFDDPRRLVWIRQLASQDSIDGIIHTFREEIDKILDELDGPRSRVNPIALRARRFIDDHAHEAVSLARVAAELGVARNYLSSLFRREFQTTLTDYIHRVRIERAKRLLMTDSRPLSEVATEVGYRSYRHFHRSFSKLCGTSPLRFAKEGPARKSERPSPAP